MLIEGYDPSKPFSDVFEAPVQPEPPAVVPVQATHGSRLVSPPDGSAPLDLWAEFDKALAEANGESPNEAEPEPEPTVTRPADLQTAGAVVEHADSRGGMRQPKRVRPRVKEPATRPQSEPEDLFATVCQSLSAWRTEGTLEYFRRGGQAVSRRPPSGSEVGDGDDEDATAYPMISSSTDAQKAIRRQIVLKQLNRL